MATMNKWELAEDPILRRRMGKTGEELSELAAVVNRIQIQGIDSVDPSSGKTNRQRLEEEMADVMAQCRVTIEVLGLDESAMHMREIEKRRQMAEWESLYR